MKTRKLTYMGKTKWVFAILLFAMILPFQNCSETLPEKTVATDGSSTGTINNGTITFSATASKGTILPGSAVSFATTVTPSSALPAGSVKISLRHSGGSLIFTDTKNFAAVSANQSANLTHDFAAPETLPPGNYMISAEIFQNGSTIAQHSLNNIASINVQAPIRVHAGATVPYTDTTGKVWAADTGFVGGVPTTELLPTVTNSADQPLWNTFRWTPVPMSYTATVPSAGKYKVTLYWIEHYVFGPNLRLFHVDINGNRVLNNFDLFTEAGGSFIAYYRSFIVTTATPTIKIDFVHGSIENPKINAIEIVGAP